MKIAWMIIPAAASALVLGGCFQSEQSVGPQRNRLTYGALSNLHWTQLPGTAKEIAAGKGSYNFIWKIGAGSGDQYVQYYDFSYGTWNYLSQNGVGRRIEVDDADNAWVVNSAGDVWRTGPIGIGGWTQFNSNASGQRVSMVDVGAGGGNIFALGEPYNSGGGYHIYKFNQTTNKWQTWTGLGMRITVDYLGNPWVQNSNGTVWQWSGTSWIDRGTWVGPNGGYLGIGAGYDGQVWICDGKGSGAMYSWNGSDWVYCDNSTAMEIDQGNGTTFVVKSSGQIWEGTP